jgi:DNA-binding NtrC family response regulator
MPDSDVTPSELLIVDDEREHAQVMCEALQRQGHHCDVTYNLREAEARLAKKRYDVIVTDMVMDGRRDGLELLRVSRQIDPPPPLILVTAHSDVPTC